MTEGKEGAVVAGIAISHPERTVYPELELTKLDLARYFEVVADRILPHVAERPLMLLRCPGGRERGCFFQKHPGRGVHESLGRVEIRESRGIGTYVYVRDVTGLVALVQMGVLELHVWGAKADDVEHPDRLVFDLDPGPGVAWADVVRKARALHELLERLELQGFLKTTGGKGLHVVVPLRRGIGWNDLRSFGEGVAAELARRDPARLILQAAKSSRPGKIYLDTLRNARGATWVAPWSPRARRGAPISMPLPWSRLGPALQPEAFSVASLERRLHGMRSDPWVGMLSARQEITPTMRRALAQGPRPPRKKTVSAPPGPDARATSRARTSQPS